MLEHWKEGFEDVVDRLVPEYGFSPLMSCQNILKGRLQIDLKKHGYCLSFRLSFTTLTKTFHGNSKQNLNELKPDQGVGWDQGTLLTSINSDKEAVSIRNSQINSVDDLYNIF
jgi:hypothetical protein